MRIELHAQSLEASLGQARFQLGLALFATFGPLIEAQGVRDSNQSPKYRELKRNPAQDEERCLPRLTIKAVEFHPSADRSRRRRRHEIGNEPHNSQREDAYRQVNPNRAFPRRPYKPH